MRVKNGNSVDGSKGPAAVSEADGQSSVTIPSVDFILTAQYSRIGSNLVLTLPDGETEFVVRDYFVTETPPDLFGDTGARVAGDLAARHAGRARQGCGDLPG